MNTSDDICRLDQAAKQQLGYRVFSIVWIVLSGVLIISGLSAWLYYRKKLIYLSKRGLMKLVLISMGLIANLLTAAVDRAVPTRTSNAHSCPVLNLGFLLAVPYIIIGGFAQVLWFRNRAALYKVLANSIDLEALSESLYSEKASFQRRISPKLKRKVFYSSEKFVVGTCCTLTITVTGIAILLTSSLCPEFGISDNCIIAEMADYRISVFIFFFVICGFVLVFYIKKTLETYPDPFNILGEVRTGFAIAFFLALPGLLLATINLGDPNGQEEVKFSYGPLTDAVFLWVLVYAVHYQIYKGLKFNEINKIYKGVSLTDILKDKVGRDLFKAHLVSEFALENLYFIEAVKDYRKAAPASLEKKANYIHDMFFKEQAINIPYKVAKTINNTFEEGEITSTLFDEAYEAIWDLTESDSLPRFKSSVEYESYVGLNDEETLI